MSVIGLLNKGGGKETFTTKVDAELMSELKQLETRIAKEAPDLDVSRGAIVENALRGFLKDATRELDRLKGAKTGRSTAASASG